MMEIFAKNIGIDIFRFEYYNETGGVSEGCEGIIQSLIF